MKRAVVVMALAFAAPALAQGDPSIPAGNPLDPGTAAVARAQEQARLQAEQVARANAIAALQRAQPAPAPVPDRDRRVRTEGYGDTIGSAIGGQATRTPQPTPYFQFEPIRTPWQPH